MFIPTIVVCAMGVCLQVTAQNVDTRVACEEANTKMYEALMKGKYVYKTLPPGLYLYSQDCVWKGKST